MSSDNAVSVIPGPMNLVPRKAKNYVPFGEFDDVFSIINSQIFFPMYITGLSGNGKTFMVEQACAKANREMIRVNVTAETDEDDLIGGFRLLVSNGASKTEFHYGPVITAMQRGAVLLLDEVDLGTAKLMCLQPILEGNPIFIKKINETIRPAPGFNIIATANTKGRGDGDGRFVGTNMMNEAFLERFAITVEQDYPSAKTEVSILNNELRTVFSSVTEVDKDFANKLTKWSSDIRKSYLDGAVSDVISTRRLVLIIRAYCIFGRDKMKSLQKAVARFDPDTKRSFLDLYSKIDAGPVAAPAKPVAPKMSEEDIPF